MGELGGVDHLLVLNTSALRLPTVLGTGRVKRCITITSCGPRTVKVLFTSRFFPTDAVSVRTVYRITRAFRPSKVVALTASVPVQSLTTMTRGFNLPNVSMRATLHYASGNRVVQTFGTSNMTSP